MKGTYLTPQRFEAAANSITHGIGAVLALVGGIVLVILACRYGTIWHIIGCSVYGTSMALLYTASTIYHANQNERARPLLRLLDHSAIFGLIAGTYTPFTLVNLHGPWGWSLLGAVWGLALLGIIGQRLWVGRKPIVTVSIYVAMGWLAIVGFKAILEAMPPGGIALLVAGGLAYTGGCVFYGWRRLPYHHAVWHLFVLTGSVLHFLAVLWYVLPSH